jgi:diguanylate cyclase (GGDEF)-like protein
MSQTDSFAPESLLLNSVMSTLKIGAVVLNASQQIILWNTWMEKHSGHTQAEVLGRNLFDLFPELRKSRILPAVQQALVSNFPSLLSQTLNKAPFALYSTPTDEAAQTRMQQAVAVIPLKVANLGRHCLIQINDVSAAVAREKLLLEQALELRSQTFSDGLTGIANRRHFDINIDKEMRRAKRTGTDLSLALIDIDYFKAYNDHYGHQQGDDCLIRVAKALSDAVRRPGDLVARYGGEEFAIIMPETNAMNAAQIMEAIRLRIAALAIEHEHSIVTRHITVSIGVATRNTDSPIEVTELIGQADRALYQAKGNGRNGTVTFDIGCAV